MSPSSGRLRNKTAAIRFTYLAVGKAGIGGIGGIAGKERGNSGGNRRTCMAVVHVHDLPLILSNEPMSGVKMRKEPPAMRGLCPVHEYG